LRDMKVEPFLLASTLRAVVAQRLVRRLCPDCREPVQCELSVAAQLGVKSGATVHRAKGCPSCRGTGFQGRIGVFEAVRVDESIRKIINAGGDEAEMAQHAFQHSPNRASAARELVKAGETTPEEAIRISRSEDPDNA
jgi:general secretion pathway protein E